MGAIRDYLRGISTTGTCGECGHGASAAAGCRCPAEWCPCHRGAYGHGAHGCTPAKHRTWNKHLI
jgi:hypothetical protein